MTASVSDVTKCVDCDAKNDEDVVWDHGMFICRMTQRLQAPQTNRGRRFGGKRCVPLNSLRGKLRTCRFVFRLSALIIFYPYIISLFLEVL